MPKGKTQKKPKEQEQAKTPKTPKEPLQNGVRRPREGTVTRRVWTICEEEAKKEGGTPARKAVMDRGTAEDLNPATIATQYGRWKKFHGLPNHEPPAKPEAKPDGEGEATPDAE